MLQQQLLQPSWPCYNTIDSFLDMDVFMGDCEFSSSFTTTEDSSDVSSIFCFPTMNQYDLPPFPVFSDDTSFMFPSDDLCLISNDHVSSDETGNVFDWMQGMEDSSETSLSSQHNFTEEGYEASMSSSVKFLDVPREMILPKEDMEINNQLSIPCLFKAYGEATENEQAELAEVILRCAKEKVSPMGSTIERLAYYFFQAFDNHGEYLLQESGKNYGAAFKAFYEILPYGRFAHLTSNLVILESVPLDVRTIHIVDFDMGDGVQWPPLIEAIGRGRAVRLTSIKRKGDCGCDCSCNCASPRWAFKDTEKRLYNHAKSLGLNLKVEEMDIEELMKEKMSMEIINTTKEWLVFNCMVGLPHMGREKSRGLVSEFLAVAKELIYSSNSTRGIITIGEGDGVKERMKNCSGVGSFLEEYLEHFHTLFQSMESHFPPHLAEARLAIEYIFVAPYISSLPCFRKWEQIKKGGSGLNSVSGMEGRRFSRENLLQAKELVKDGNSMYSVKVEGEKGNMMTLEWRGSPLIKVSTWG